MACPMMADCPLFPMFGTQAFLRVWQINYCEAAYQKCVRFEMASEGCHVPPTVLPNGKHLPVLQPGRKEK